MIIIDVPVQVPVRKGEEDDDDFFDDNDTSACDHSQRDC